MAKSADPAEKEETFSLSSSDEVDDDDVANWVADASDSDAFDECVPEGLSEEGASGTAVQEAPEKGSNSSSSPPPPAHVLPPPPLSSRQPVWSPKVLLRVHPIHPALAASRQRTALPPQ